MTNMKHKITAKENIEAMLQSIKSEAERCTVDVADWAKNISTVITREDLEIKILHTEVEKYRDELDKILEEYRKRCKCNKRG